MAKGIRYYRGLMRQKSVLEKAGVTAQDYFIASFPKSGNTWLRYLIAAARFSVEPVTPQNIDLLLPSVYNEPFVIDHLVPPRYIKTHDAYFSIYPRTLYICRDYRDVAVSAFFYWQKKGNASKNIHEFVRGKELNTFGPWHWHVGTALEWKEKHPEQLLFIRYEDLLADTEKTLAEVLRFCHISPDRPLAEIIAEASFSSLQKKEKQSGEKNTGFFRKGISGDWKNHLDESDVDALLKPGNTREIMQQLGYL